MPSARRGPDRVEVALLCAFAAVIGAALEYAWMRPKEADGLRSRYGRSHYSIGVEEWIVRDFFGDRRDGVFLDVGSADAREDSNTYDLESELGWSGVAIDAQAEYAESYRLHRPRTKFLSFVVSDTSDQTATLWIGQQHRGSASSNQAFTTSYAGTDVQAREVPTITLNDLLRTTDIERIDFVSMDIEMHEPQALAGFDLQRYRPTPMCIESHPPIRQRLIDDLSAQGYQLQARYLWIDRENFSFARSGGPSCASRVRHRVCGRHADGRSRRGCGAWRRQRRRRSDAGW